MPVEPYLRAWKQFTAAEWSGFTADHWENFLAIRPAIVRIVVLSAGLFTDTVESIHGPHIKGVADE